MELGNQLSHEAKPMPGGGLVSNSHERLTYHTRDVSPTSESRDTKGPEMTQGFMRTAVLKGSFKKMLVFEMLSSLRAVSVFLAGSSALRMGGGWGWW